MSGEVYLLRHGETEWNLDGRLQGQQDSPLTELGRRQAQLYGDLLAAIFAAGDLPHLQVSPLGRAQQTANLMRARFMAAPYLVEPRLTEVGFGDWEGLTFDDIEQEWSELIDCHDDLDWLFEAPGGEGYDLAMARAESWLAGQAGSLIAVSHGLTSQLICSSYLGLNRRDVAAFTVEHGVIYHLHDGKIDTIRG